MLAWCLVSAGAIFARLKMQRQATAPIFVFYLILAAFCGLGLIAVGAITACTGQYPQYGALVALIALLFNPLALLSLFFAPMHLNRATIAFLVAWDLFILASMYATADGCPGWIMILEAACGLILVLGSVLTYFQLKAQPADCA